VAGGLTDVTIESIAPSIEDTFIELMGDVASRAA
jgi:hypothetical protein